MPSPSDPGRRPLVLAASSLAAGILTGYYLPLSPVLVLLLILVGTGTFIITEYRKSIILLVLITFISGYCLLSWQEYKYRSERAVTSWNDLGPVVVTGEIEEELNALEGSKLYLRPFFINGKQVSYGLIQLERRDLAEDYIDYFKNGQLVRLRLSLETPPAQLNPAGFSYLKYLKKKGVFSLGYPAGDPQILSRGKRVIKNTLITMKRALLAVIDRLRAPYNELLKALLLGERENLPLEWEEGFTKAGVNHLLAISGLHVGFVLLIFLGLLQVTGLTPGIRNFIISFMLLVYIIITGFRPSVFRAGLLAIAFLWAPYFNRRGDVFNLLGFTSLVNLSWRPYDLFNIGFQLTYLVLIMIIIWYPLLRKWFFPPLAVSIAAQLGSMPLIAYYFNLLSPAGLLTNIWAIPLIGIVVSLGLIGLLMGLINPLLGWLLFQPAVFLLFVVGRGIELMVNLPFSWLEVPSPSPFNLLIATTSLFVLPFLLQKKILPFNRRKRERRLYFSLVLLLIFLIGNVITPLRDDELEIIFFAVGQGDSILLNFPGGRSILVDGGGPAGYDSSKGEQVILPYLKKRGIRTLELVFGTHFDADHVQGLQDVLQSRKIGLLVIPVNFEMNKMSENILATAVQQKIPVRSGTDGEYFKIGEARVEILAPSPRDRFSSNENSLVLQVRYRNFSLMLTGDLGKEGEQRLINSGAELRNDILKLGHHGSDTSSGYSFLSSVSPGEAVVSVGRKNSYGHPDEEVLKRVKDLGTRIWRTDRQGAVIVRTDGFHYTIRGFKN